MKSLLFFTFLLVSTIFKPIESQCSGGIWPIQDASIGSFTVSWQYALASNTVQFIIQGQAISSINLSSTYIAIGWSASAPNMNNMDVAMYFPGTQIVQDRYSQGHAVPSVDTQQDFCVIQTNTSDRNVYVTFERFVVTSDTNDISFTSNLYLMFAMGPYTFSNATNTFNPQHHFFRIAYQTSTSLTSCVSNGCLTTNCTVASCPCLQQITSGAAQCVCFTPSSCVSGSTITPRTTTTTTTTTTAILSTLPTALTGSCQNQPNLCSPNGLCLQISSTQHMCQCVNNYIGVNCQTPLFSNATATAITTAITTNNSCSCPFVGGVCLANGSCVVSGTCTCAVRYQGNSCQSSNSCVIVCSSNGTFSTVCTGLTCTAVNCNCSNSTGVPVCNTTTGGLCQSNPCLNGNCVVLANGSSQCQCNTGFFGAQCNLINSCQSNPCNQGTCVTSSNCQNSLCGYSCLCPNGTSGTNCEIGANPCLSSPCQNNGLCIIVSNAYSCQCLSPYGGTNCNSQINVCTPNPCLNNGVCTSNSNIPNGTYQCACPTNFVGRNCQYLSSCIFSPCVNGGQCLTSTMNCSSTTCAATCICPIGTTGVYCEQQDTSCVAIPCQNGGTCLINSTNNVRYCQCPSFSSGARCENMQMTCSPATCANGGICFIDASASTILLRCICMQGYTGQYCQSLLNAANPCLQFPCGLNGTCLLTSNSSYYCMCPNNVVAQSCASNTFMSCADSPCRSLSTCQQLTGANSTGYQCMCPSHLTGQRCQYTNNCQKQPCFNQGTCIPLGPQNSFRCSCQPGFGNYDCSTYLGNTCNATVCLNGGTRIYNNTNIGCVCAPGYTGARCDWSLVCSTSTCLNNGTCRQRAATMAECLCAIGFTGPTCSLYDSCANFPCKHGAGCATLPSDAGTGWSSYQCTCPSGYYGQNCDTRITSCVNMVCPSYMICSEQASGPICTCPGNKVGTFCQYTNPCSVSSSAICLHGGTCVSSNTDPPVASCLCRNGHAGSNCAVTTLNDLCSSNPCQSHGYCALTTTNTSYSCVCQTNYTGDYCERANPCASSPCLNQGVCQSYWNSTNIWFTCRCVGTFTGATCETSLLNPCNGLCMNGSPCVNGVCVCPTQYAGTFCGLPNPCYNQQNISICQHGGFCSANYNATAVSFTCTCRNTYSGQFCESILPVVFTSGCAVECANGGTCLNGMCICTSQYVGASCECVNPCFNQSICVNSGTCFGQYLSNGTLFTQCFCLQGYTGRYCEATLCSSTACNGGTCLAAQNTLVCTCPPGKIGDRCQYADACATNPCQSTEQCQQTGNQYQCISCYDQSALCSVYRNYTLFCDNRYSLTVNNVPVPVLVACRLSCGQCNSTNGKSLPVQKRAYDSSIFTEEENEEDWTTEVSRTTTTSSTSTTTRSTTSTLFKLNIILSRTAGCVDQRDDCLTQKAYGYCDSLNENYPHACMKTCHPSCANGL